MKTKLSIRNSDRLVRILYLIQVLVFITSCDELLKIDPPKDKVTSEAVFSDDITAISAMTGIYHELMNAAGFSGGNFQGITMLAGMSSDELKYNNNYIPTPELFEFNQNNLNAQNQYVKTLWGSIYKSIYSANAMIDGLARSNAVTGDISNQLRGEALFVRAFCYFNAVNLFGNVPLIATPDYRENARAGRATIEAVYKQIVDDLTEAKKLLKEGYVRGANLQATDRVRVNKYAASALLARVYLYLKDWPSAELEATSVIGNTTLYELNSDAGKAFLASNSSNINKEAIWQLMPVAYNTANINTWEGNIFIINDPNSYRVVISDELYNSFEVGDSRMQQWIGTYVPGGGLSLFFPFKYKIKNGGNPLVEYSMVLRLAEQYLIRSESRAQQGNISGAQDDLNIIRKRVSLGNTSATDQNTILEAIKQERRVELFCEWAHRWFDLKRWNEADDVLEPLRLSNWHATDVLYPVPQSEIDQNSNLHPQNSGY